jgi:hypothetical protein
VRLWRRLRHKPPHRLPPFEIPGTGVTDFARMIYGLYHAVPPALRQNVYWVMDPWWLEWCYEYAATTSQPEPIRAPGVQAELLGKPVLVIETGGWPHLEPTRRSHPHLTPR